MTRLGLAAACVVSATAACAVAEIRAPGPRTGTASLAASIDDFLAPYVDSQNFSGTIMVSRGGRLIAGRGYGWADAARGIPNTLSTRFQIGSISKGFTAAAVLRLRDRGVLRLQDPLDRFLPDFPLARDITLHQLLVHTSGIGRFVFQSDYPERSQQPHTAADLVDWAATLPRVGEPGARAAYSNANYSILARVVEIASGLEYAAFLRTEFFEPLGLRDTGHRGIGAPAIDQLASGHTLVGASDLSRSTGIDYTVFTGAGSLFSTVGDLDRWFRALHSGAVLEAESTRLAFTEHAAGRGYGWMIARRGDRPVIAMSGWDGAGFSTRLVHVLGDDVTVVVLCNLNVSALPDEIARNIVALALGEAPVPLSLLPAASSSDLSALAGTYRFGPEFYVPNTVMRLGVANGGLVVLDDDRQPVGALLPTSDGSFIHRQMWFRVGFDRDASGGVTGMRYDSFRAAREDVAASGHVRP